MLSASKIVSVFTVVVEPPIVKSPAITALPTASTVKFPLPTLIVPGAKAPVKVKSFRTASLLLSITAVPPPINNLPIPAEILISPDDVISVASTVVNAPVSCPDTPTLPSKLVDALITVPSIVVAPIVVLSATLAPIVVPSIAPPLISTLSSFAKPPSTVSVVPITAEPVVVRSVNPPVFFVPAPIVPVTAPVSGPTNAAPVIVPPSIEPAPVLIVPATRSVNVPAAAVAPPMIVPLIVPPSIVVVAPVKFTAPVAVTSVNVAVVGALAPIIASKFDTAIALVT